MYAYFCDSSCIFELVTHKHFPLLLLEKCRFGDGNLLYFYKPPTIECEEILFEQNELYISDNEKICVINCDKPSLHIYCSVKLIRRLQEILNINKQNQNVNFYVFVSKNYLTKSIQKCYQTTF